MLHLLWRRRLPVPCLLHKGPDTCSTLAFNNARKLWRVCRMRRACGNARNASTRTSRAELFVTGAHVARSAPRSFTAATEPFELTVAALQRATRTHRAAQPKAARTFTVPPLSQHQMRHLAHLLLLGPPAPRLPPSGLREKAPWLLPRTLAKTTNKKMSLSFQQRRLSRHLRLLQPNNVVQEKTSPKATNQPPKKIKYRAMKLRGDASRRAACAGEEDTEAETAHGE